ncbi:MAG: 5'-methylthioadenosine/adenosylhomocysteine nucleosidase [Defluviitaleaceae bacterium]|nr:5'-methylthioadenosine/adenosylhomocysteine nucleosidase [Defluviitaleaceae bacterium]
MTGIIGAMQVEVEGLIKKMSNTVIDVYSGVTFVRGKLGDTDVVVAKCGMGKVNAAVCVQTMILMYKPKIILNTGVAGSISNALRIGDIVIGQFVVQHDYDLTPIGHEKGYIEEVDKILFPCDQSAVEILEKIAAKHGTYHTGVIATGDQFVDRIDIKNEISGKFNALAVEMEGASLAHVCDLNNIPFGIVRVISDSADMDSHFEFFKFVEETAKISIEIISEFVQINK